MSQHTESHCHPGFVLQASALTQNVTGPVGLVTPNIHWSSNFFTGPANLSLT